MATHTEPVLGPPSSLTSMISSDSKSRRKWRMRSISAQDLRLSVKSSARNNSRAPSKPAKLVSKAVAHNIRDHKTPRPCQQAYRKGKAVRHVGEPRDGRIFQAHEDKVSEIEAQSSNERPTIVVNKIDRALSSIAELLDDDDHDIWLPPNSVPPIPRRSSKRIPHIKAARDVRAPDRFPGECHRRKMTIQQRIERHNKEVFAYHFSGTLLHPPLPPPKDASVKNAITTVSQDRAYHRHARDDGAMKVKQSFLDQASLFRKQRPTDTTGSIREPGVHPPLNESQTGSTTSLYALLEDAEDEDIMNGEGAVLASFVPAKMAETGETRQEHLANNKRNFRDKKSCFSMSPFARKFKALRPLHSPTASKKTSAADTPEDKSNMAQNPLGIHHEPEAETAILRDRTLFAQRLGETCRRFTSSLPQLRSKRSTYEIKQIRAVQDQEDYEKQKMNLFVAMNSAREQKDLQITKPNRKHTARNCHSSPEVAVVQQRIEKLKFDRDLDADAEVAAHGQDLAGRMNSGAERGRNADTLQPPTTTDVSWLEDHGLDHVQLVGPPHYGAMATGVLWCEGAHHRHAATTVHPERELNSGDASHDGNCLCKNHLAWQTITDERYRYVGIARTKREKRWVVHLARCSPRPGVTRAPSEIDRESDSPSIYEHDEEEDYVDWVYEQAPTRSSSYGWNPSRTDLTLRRDSIETAGSPACPGSSKSQIKRKPLPKSRSQLSQSLA